MGVKVLNNLKIAHKSISIKIGTLFDPNPKNLNLATISIKPTKNLMISLSEVETQQRKLISNFSHELRTSLTISYGYMQSIYRRSENLTDMQKQALENALAEMKCTIDLLQESLDLARLGQDSNSFVLTPASLNKIVLEAIATFGKDGKEENTLAQQREIIVEGIELNLFALADVDRLPQVLIRLIDNAIRYSDKIINIKMERYSNYSAISICDRGCGIPLQDQSRIFSPFYRVDPARSRLNGGAGMGLAIAKVLVEGMEGTLEVQSQLGKGSVFKIMLKSAI